MTTQLATVLQFPTQRATPAAAPAMPDLTGMTFKTVTAANVQEGDLIGGELGAWHVVKRVFVDPYARDLAADIDIAPVTDTGRVRTWSILADAKMAILRAKAGA